MSFKYRNKLKIINLTEKFKADRTKLQMEFQEVLETRKHHALCILDHAKIFGGKTALHDKIYGQWESISWSQFAERINATASALLESGMKEQDRIGIFSGNRSEWHIADLGSQLIRLINVPVYPSNSTKETEYIINHSGMRLLFVSTQVQYNLSYELLDKCPSLEKLVVFHRGTKIANDPRVVMWDDFLELGRKKSNSTKIEKIKKECSYNDIMTIVYTSGTTGDPKGVMLTHKNFLHNSWAIGKYLQGPFTPKSSTLSWLPLSLALERSWDYCFLTSGASIWYCDDYKKVMDYIQEANTTHMFNAARLFEKVYSTLFTNIQKQSKIKQKIFFWSIDVAKKAGDMVLQGGVPSSGLRFRLSIADRLVLGKIRQLFGKNMHHLGSGGSSLNPEIEKFFFYCGMLITQGYGLTETSPGITFNGHEVFKLGTVGSVIPLSEIRIEQSTGELQFRGPNVFKEYYKDPQSTKDAFTEDGWLKSGDTGIMDRDGFVIITGRLKDIIKTAGGKSVSPQKIERLMREDHYIDNIAVIGDGKRFITAIIAPDFLNLAEWAHSNGIKYSSFEDLIAKPEVISLYNDIIEKRQKDLNHAEMIKKFTLIPRGFLQEEGEITPTLKIKRKFIIKNYKDIIDTMYRE